MTEPAKPSRLISRAQLATGEVWNIDKPAGWTSFDVVNKLRRASRIAKVGHAGTLDPFATGVLLICFASATRKVEQLMGLEKEYEGVVELGVETDSHDVTGKILATRPVPALTREQVEQTLAKYRGTFMQRPPVFSALKRGGRRLYQLARAGEAVEADPRPVTIHVLDLLAFEPPLLRLRLLCSRGTYVRSLARDLGEDLGCGAYLKSLCRTRVGPYRLVDSLTVTAFIKSLVD
ncbi:MAG: tRNA pseudouridine(55) synthase TruB [candidate division KSB1 bacterium]|nr:tRNA pseudouridine(55) synthase TruB [candidate division KSB1 bacterium]MDZ7275480.1 tRNA pseudouridine(55) synthase TruB [candidate division KSB1 bacterium]MDZ7286208.1 tRNA pseudouridine(55) synthase TruB [candidate division KSB1 bacterium]MDZ7296434.1 tRNA pseudouridine(55) synthase TruB [candidate division KSB1 bacterium]MDZ7309279.1 tRNA pseudouridine(55) synthase TruB [candidate division KSB1 bacterium]